MVYQSTWFSDVSIPPTPSPPTFMKLCKCCAFLVQPTVCVGKFSFYLFTFKASEWSSSLPEPDSEWNSGWIAGCKIWEVNYFSALFLGWLYIVARHWDLVDSTGKFNTFSITTCFYHTTWVKAHMIMSASNASVVPGFFCEFQCMCCIEKAVCGV